MCLLIVGIIMRKAAPCDLSWHGCRKKVTIQLAQLSWVELTEAINHPQVKCIIESHWLEMIRIPNRWSFGVYCALLPAPMGPAQQLMFIQVLSGRNGLGAYQHHWKRMEKGRFWRFHGDHPFKNDQKCMTSTTSNTMLGRRPK